MKKKGFIPVMLTPFKDNGAIDFDVLTKLTELYMEAGANGMFANCLSSEMFELTDLEKIQVIKHVIKVVNGTMPVVATGTFAGTIDQQADFVKQVGDTGTDAVIVITGLLAAETDSDDVFNEKVYKLFDKTEKVPLGFYECPVPYKRLLSPTQLIDFVKTGRVVYHKDTCLDLDTIKDKLKATEFNPAFGLYDAYMGHAVDSLKAGSAGLSCIQGNFFPELIVWLCNNYNNADLTMEVDAVQQFLIDQMDVMHNIYPIIAKYYLKKRGFEMSTFTRRDVGVFSPRIISNIDKLYTDYQKLGSEFSEFKNFQNVI